MAALDDEEEEEKEEEEEEEEEGGSTSMTSVTFRHFWIINKLSKIGYIYTLCNTDQITISDYCISSNR
jgi:hypothetical protein